MTERLYYKNSSLLEFEAEIVETESKDNLYYTVLDKTAFYPSSGGQLHDVGTLAGVEIVDVVENEQGVISHISKTAVSEIGKTVKGKIDYDRRLRHKQQHSGQHILSHTFYKLFNMATVSVHLGEEYGAIEFDSNDVTFEQLTQAETYANRMIWSNYKIDILFVDSDKIQELPMRRPPKKSGEIRVIKIGEEEYSACGGTHCEATAEIGLLKIIGLEKIRNHILVKFLSGVQTLSDYKERFDVTTQLTQRLTCHLADLPAKFEKLSDENRQLRYELSQIQKDMIPSKAEEIAAESQKAGSHAYVFFDLGSFDKKLVNLLANLISEKITGLASLVFDGKMVIASDKASALDCSLIARKLSERTSLKGGGNKNLAQLGGVTDENISEIEMILKEIITDA